MQTSSLAYIHTFYAPRPASVASQREYLFKLYGPIMWLFRFLLKAALGGHETQADLNLARGMASMSYNRASRRYVGHHQSPNNSSLKAARKATKKAESIRRKLLIARIFSRGLSPAQYLEKRARLFVDGRARVYRLRFWGSRLQRRARLSCYDHGIWRAPLSAATGGGMWEAQLPPD